MKEYEKKIEDIKDAGIDFYDVERRVLLMNVDRNWIDHIDAMDQLRKGIGLRAYGQVDPVISYKKEGFEMFDEMIERIQRTSIAVLLKVKVEFRQAPPQPLRRQMPEQGAASPAPARKPFRRQMPEPLSSMSSFKEASSKQAELLRAANGNSAPADGASDDKTENK